MNNIIYVFYHVLSINTYHHVMLYHIIQAYVDCEISIPRPAAFRAHETAQGCWQRCPVLMGAAVVTGERLDMSRP